MMEEQVGRNSTSGFGSLSKSLSDRPTPVNQLSEVSPLEASVNEIMCALANVGEVIRCLENKLDNVCRAELAEKEAPEPCPPFACAFDQMMYDIHAGVKITQKRLEGLSCRICI